MQGRRYREARAVMIARPGAPDAVVQDLLDEIEALEQADARRQVLEKQKEASPGGLESDRAIELATVYRDLNMKPKFEGQVLSILNSTNAPPRVVREVATLCGTALRWELQATALRRYLQSTPRDCQSWGDLAYAELILKKPEETMSALRHAVEVCDDFARRLREDLRFSSINDTPLT